MAGGGYRRPSHPAPVSGPAQLSQRTDGGPGQAVRALPDAKYGENRDYQAQEQGAPLAKQPETPTPPPPSAQVPAGPPPDQAAQPAPPPGPPLTGFNAPTDRPGEPVTAGSPLGPGPGPQAAAQGPQQGQLSSALQPYFAADDTGYIRLLAEDLAGWGL